MAPTGCAASLACSRGSGTASTTSRNLWPRPRRGAHCGQRDGGEGGQQCSQQDTEQGVAAGHARVWTRGRCSREEKEEKEGGGCGGSEEKIFLRWRSTPRSRVAEKRARLEALTRARASLTLARHHTRFTNTHAPPTAANSPARPLPNSNAAQKAQSRGAARAEPGQGSRAGRDSGKE